MNNAVTERGSGRTPLEAIEVDEGGAAGLESAEKAAVGEFFF